VLRAIRKSPEALDALLDEIGLAAGGDARLDAHLRMLQDTFPAGDCPPRLARSFVGGLALAWQASLLIRAGNTAVSEAFCAARLGGAASGNLAGSLYGALPAGIDCRAILERSLPSA
jgi:putative acyl-CoA dehydrogenase